MSRDTLTPGQVESVERAMLANTSTEDGHYDIEADPAGLLDDLAAAGLAVVPVETTASIPDSEVSKNDITVVPVGEPDGLIPPEMVADTDVPALAIHYAVNACMRGKRYLTTHVTGDTMSLLEDSGWRLTRSDAAGGGNDE